MTHSRSRSLFLLSVAAAALGCSSSSSPTTPVGFCSAIYTPAVSVVAVDSVTGAPLAGAATGHIQMTGVNDTLYHGSASTDSLLYGGNAAGTWQVTITRTGYQSWVRAGIVVTPTGVCNELNTVSMRARLQPAP